MKQFRFEYNEVYLFTQKLIDFKKKCDANNRKASLFQIYSEVLDVSVIRKVCNMIERVFPDMPYMGCSTSGNIIDCGLSSDITVVCTVFDIPSTRTDF